jgi:hypothetical protein
MFWSAGLAATLHSAPNPASFSDRRDYAANIGAVAIGDLNGDGVPDIFGCDGEAGQTEFGNGDGTFTPGALSAAESHAWFHC